jgi:hypothetical protein
MAGARFRSHLEVHSAARAKRESLRIPRATSSISSALFHASASL